MNTRRSSCVREEDRGAELDTRVGTARKGSSFDLSDQLQATGQFVHVHTHLHEGPSRLPCHFGTPEAAQAHASAVDDARPEHGTQPVQTGRATRATQFRTSARRDDTFPKQTNDNAAVDRQDGDSRAAPTQARQHNTVDDNHDHDDAFIIDSDDEMIANLRGHDHTFTAEHNHSTVYDEDVRRQHDTRTSSTTIQNDDNDNNEDMRQQTNNDLDAKPGVNGNDIDRHNNNVKEENEKQLKNRRCGQGQSRPPGDRNDSCWRPPDLQNTTATCARDDYDNNDHHGKDIDTGRCTDDEADDFVQNQPRPYNGQAIGPRGWHDDGLRKTRTTDRKVPCIDLTKNEIHPIPDGRGTHDEDNARQTRPPQPPRPRPTAAIVKRLAGLDAYNNLELFDRMLQHDSDDSVKHAWSKWAWAEDEQEITALHIFTDGAADLKVTSGCGIVVFGSSVNNGMILIGWAFAPTLLDSHSEFYVGATGHTAPVAEASAIHRVLHGVAAIVESHTLASVTINADATYVLDIVKGTSAANSNIMLVQGIRRMVGQVRRRTRIIAKHVKGHSGDPGNEFADLLSNLGKEGKTFNHFYMGYDELPQPPEDR